MDISVAHQGDKSIVTVSGRIDSSNSSQLLEPLNELVDQGHVHLVLEMSGVDYMSSAGLRVILSVMKNLKVKGGNLKIASPSNTVRGVLMMAGSEIFDTHDSVEGATS